MITCDTLARANRGQRPLLHDGMVVFVGGRAEADRITHKTMSEANRITRNTLVRSNRGQAPAPTRGALVFVGGRA
ncbi:hypothetical protein C0068_14490 [Zhongshania marina]|uniref:Uncharacterized protein n=1 Tax=Zhongshania marina TaxID=2304603 RepID=A0A2S4HDY8_9GAMM|nr:hypothetical protein C0068_14490 [Marortus luteolus]